MPIDARAAAPRADGPCFVSTRADGLCMRLATLLDTMLLARWFEGRFGFFWDVTPAPAVDQQTFDAPERVFTRDFLGRHRLPESANDPAAPDLTTQSSTDEAFSQLLESARRGRALYLHQPRHLPGFMPFLADRYRAGDYAATFAEIGFTDEVRRAIALARQVPLAPGAVAIHLRGGDILHGTHANTEAYLHKAPSIPEVEALCDVLAADRRPTWLVGQEPDVQACVVRRHPTVCAIGVTHPTPAVDDVARVLFDATLMSRMVQLYGGSSGVTLLARRLGGGLPFIDLAMQPPGVAIEALLCDPLSDPDYAGVSAASKAHAYLKPVALADSSEWSERDLRLIGLARQHRPGSKFLALVEVAVLAQLCRAEAAESHCRALLSQPIMPSLEPEMAFAFLLGAAHYFPWHVTAPLTAATSPCCALFSRLRHMLKRPDDASRDAALQALCAAEAALAPEAIDPTFRGMLLRCIT